MTAFVTAVNCIDGRVQEPISRYLKMRCGVAYVDMITCPGPAGVLARGEDTKLIAQLAESVRISVSRHGSRCVAIVAHHDCAANDLPEHAQRRQVENAIDRIRTWAVGISVLGLWVDADWQVAEVRTIEVDTLQKGLRPSSRLGRCHATAQGKDAIATLVNHPSKEK